MSSTSLSSPPSGATARRQATRLAGLPRAGLEGAPVSIAIVLSLWTVGLITGTLAHGPDPDLSSRIGIGAEALRGGHLWAVLTAGFLTPGSGGLFVATALILAVAVPIEHRIGSARFVVSAIVAEVLGVMLALGSAALIALFHTTWGAHLQHGIAIGPGLWLVGVVTASSVAMPTMWRRRIRLGMFFLLTTLALFGGALDDLIRLGTAVAGLLVGPVIFRSDTSTVSQNPTLREKRVLVAIVVVASTVGPLLAAISPGAVGPLSSLRDMFSSPGIDVAQVRTLCATPGLAHECHRGLRDLQLSGAGPYVLMLMPTVLMLVLSDGLRRGRRLAWLAAVAATSTLLGLGVMVTAVRYFTRRHPGQTAHDVIGLALELLPYMAMVVVVLVLLLTRRLFSVTTPRGARRRTARTIVAAFVVSAGVYVVIGTLTRNGFDRAPTAPELLLSFPQRLVPPVFLQFLTPAYLPQALPATILYEWVGVLFWIVVSFVLLSSLLTPSDDESVGSRTRARDLLHSNGGSALSWMTTWSGNRYWFSADGSSFVGYRVVGGVALTTGDPVGPPDHLQDNMKEFSDFCTLKGWTPCFYSATGRVAETAHRVGWSAIHIAENTVLDLDELSFTGKKFQDVRTAINKAKKVGVHAEWVSFATAPVVIVDQITMISNGWIAERGMPEMGFTLGGLEELSDPEVRCLVAIDDDRTVHAVTSWLPVYERGRPVGWTLDLMRRRSLGFNPSIEFLIASAALLFREEGATFLSLSGAPLARAEQEPVGRVADSERRSGAALEWIMDALGRTLEPVYGFRSLLAFKSKFQPQYAPMYLVFPDAVALPSIVNAVARAYLPDASLGQQIRVARKLLRIG
ncbi:bifunctional lysylphosphatidylglycerol flippase/synthetase MprF [Rhodococcus sp. NPDC127528]|uniref:bifunctional lysylphosphatidylglycerol flippase/synthetase MprF n=1 Tax=unclassified Rhodococcus (in: high G+C Gram-positive bacteria) TaxID=192944 RepID=UPI0036290196